MATPRDVGFVPSNLSPRPSTPRPVLRCGWRLVGELLYDGFGWSTITITTRSSASLFSIVPKSPSSATNPKYWVNSGGWNGGLFQDDGYPSSGGPRVGPPTMVYVSPWTNAGAVITPDRTMID